MQKLFLILSIVLIVACKKPQPDILDALEKGKWIDLTYGFDANSVYWPTNIPFTHDTVFCGINSQGYFYSSFKFAAEEHGGTHFDAPMHFGEGKSTIEKIPFKQLFGKGIVLNVSDKTVGNPDYLVTIADFIDWEKENGKIPDSGIVLINTGWGKYYSNKEKYTGTLKTGIEAVAELHFPGLSPEAAEWLTTERKIDAVGLDTPSIDYGQSKDFQAHRILCARDLTVYENVANLEQLPPTGLFVIAFPMKIKGGSGAPLRIAAFIPNN